MSYNILNIWRSGQSVIGNSSSATQYDGPIVATTAISAGRFVCSGPTLRAITSPGLSLPAGGAKSSRVAAGPRTKNRFYGQFASAAGGSSANPLPAERPAHQRGCGSSSEGVVGTKLWAWLRAISTASRNAFFNTVRIVAPQPSWPRSMNCCRPAEPQTPRN